MSTATSDFRGLKILFTAGLHPRTKERLVQLGFILLDSKIPNDQHVCNYRWKLLADWLDVNPVNRVFFTDVRDVVIQSDPFVWMDSHPANLYAAGESAAIQANIHNCRWIDAVYGVKARKSVEGGEILCAGTVAGRSDAIKRLARAIYRDCSMGDFGHDQAALNYLLRTEFREEWVEVPAPEEGFVLTGGFYFAGVTARDADGAEFELSADTLADVRDGVIFPKAKPCPFCVVHQYDRSEQIAIDLSQRYALLDHSLS